MADISDVTSALVNIIVATIYPNSTNQPPLAGAAVRVFEGWPVPQQLDADMATGNTTQVSVFPLPGEQPATRYLNDGEAVLSISPAKLHLAIADQTITVSGTIPTADDRHTLVALVNGRVYTYVVQTADTLNSAAAGLAAAINADPPGASSAGPVIAVAGAALIGGARVAVTGQYAREVRRQNRPVQITVWAPTPQIRSAIASAIDVALADTRFLSLADQKARMVYRSSSITDSGQKDRAWRRDLIYAIDFGTTVVKTTTTVAAEVVTVAAQGPDQTVAATPVLSKNF